MSVCVACLFSFIHSNIKHISRILVSVRGSFGAGGSGPRRVLYGVSGKAVRLFIARARNPECQEASPRAHGARRRRPQSRGPGFVDFPFLTKGSVSTHYAVQVENEIVSFLWRGWHCFGSHVTT